MFYPFDILLTLCFSSKYRIRDNHINPSEKKFYIPRFRCVSFVVATTVYRVFRQDMHRFFKDDNTFLIVFLSFFLPTARCLGFVLNIVLNIIYSHNNVLLIVLIQIILKNFDLGKTFRSFILWNWILVATVFSIIVFTFICFGATAYYFDVINCLVELVFISFEIDYILCYPSSNIAT